MSDYCASKLRSNGLTHYLFFKSFLHSKENSDFVLICPKCSKVEIGKFFREKGAFPNLSEITFKESYFKEGDGDKDLKFILNPRNLAFDGIAFLYLDCNLKHVWRYMKAFRVKDLILRDESVDSSDKQIFAILEISAEELHLQFSPPAFCLVYFQRLARMFRYPTVTFDFDVKEEPYHLRKLE